MLSPRPTARRYAKSSTPCLAYPMPAVGAAFSGSATSDVEEALFVTVEVGSGERATEDPCAGFLFQCYSRV
jgi:hypothetical protein